MVEVKVSKQPLLISSLMLIIDLDVLPCLLYFFMIVKLLIHLSTLNYSRFPVLDSFNNPVE